MSRKNPSIVKQAADYPISMIKQKKQTGKHKQRKQGKITTQTEKNYRKKLITFVKWCRATYGCRMIGECPPHIQDYADWLRHQQHRAPDTIHNHAAALCRIFGVPLETIQKPLRVAALATRSRGRKPSDKNRNTKRECSPKLFDAALEVGVRRNEYAGLMGSDWMVDEAGYPCIQVRHGKGGKYQLQRILPHYVEDVKALFDGSENYVFTKAELTNHIDLHHLRQLAAQEAYYYYYDRLRAEPGYRDQLTDEVRKRWETYNWEDRDSQTIKNWDPACVMGTYTLRGANREFALRNGLPIHYDRLAVMAVSVFKLSHWRCDVTVSRYLLPF